MGTGQINYRLFKGGYKMNNTVSLEEMLQRLAHNWIGMEWKIPYLSIPKSSYPPYNVVKLEGNRYLISIAVAGFTKDELDISVKENMLEINSVGRDEKTSAKVLYQGIAQRTFTLAFTLDEFVEVNTAVLKDGLLNIHLVRNVPVGRGTKRIEITTAEGI